MCKLKIVVLSIAHHRRCCSTGTAGNHVSSIDANQASVIRIVRIVRIIDSSGPIRSHHHSYGTIVIVSAFLSRNLSPRYPLYSSHLYLVFFYQQFPVGFHRSS